MKVGDMIKFKGSFNRLPTDKERSGTLIGCGNFAEDWWDILDCDGKLVVWPETQLEVISESR